MSITTKGRANFAQSMINDKRTAHNRSQVIQELDIPQIIQDIKSRPEPLHKEGDAITLEDGTTRNITFRTYSKIKSEWLYRLETETLNQWGGKCQSRNYTQAEIISMTSKPATPKPDANKWIVQFKVGRESSQFKHWINNDGEVALFDHEIAIYFAQHMVMAHDARKQWAIFRIRPYEGYEGERHFFTLIQPDGTYHAATAVSAIQYNLTICLYNHNLAIVPVKEYEYEGESAYFLRHLIGIQWQAGEQYAGSLRNNPIQPSFKTTDELLLPTGHVRLVQFITPYWIAAGQIGFRYWFYIQGKQLVSYTEAELVYTGPASIEEKIDALPSFYESPKSPVKHIIGVHEMPTLPFYAETIKSLLQRGKDAEPNILAEKDAEIAELERKNQRLLDVLHDIQTAARKQEGGDIDSLWGWLAYMASMGLEGGYYSEDILKMFDKPHTHNCEKDKI